MTSAISIMEQFTHASLPGVIGYAMTPNPERGKPQQILVEVEPHGVIPLHTHGVEARMGIVAGDGYVLSDDPVTNGVFVQKGTCVKFEKDKPHGFQAGIHGLIFVSDNDGIVGPEWDMVFTPNS